MNTYLVRRIFQSIAFVFVAGLLIYTTLVMLMPDGPGYNYDRYKRDLEVITGPQPMWMIRPTVEEQIRNLEQRYKLDKPWPLNYLTWLFDPNDTSISTYDIMGNPVVLTKGIDVELAGLRLKGSGILTGDLGTSTGFASGAPVSELFANRWGNTAILLGASLALAMLVGIPLGIFGALRQRSALDHTLTIFSLSGLSMPPFVLGLLLIIFFAVLPKALRDQNGWDWLPWLPAGGIGSESLTSRITHLALPAAALAIPQIAWMARYARFAMLDVLRQDYIRTAWAKGLRARRVIFRHALRNALAPIITQIALVIPTLVSGALVVETVFAYEGMGKAFYRALGGCLLAGSLQSQDPPPCPRVGYFPIDYPLALSLLLVTVVVVAFANIVADILYTITDPRINYDTGKDRP